MQSQNLPRLETPNQRPYHKLFFQPFAIRDIANRSFPSNQNSRLRSQVCCLFADSMGSELAVRVVRNYTPVIHFIILRKQNCRFIIHVVGGFSCISSHIQLGTYVCGSLSQTNTQTENHEGLMRWNKIGLKHRRLS